MLDKSTLLHGIVRSSDGYFLPLWMGESPGLCSERVLAMTVFSGEILKHEYAKRAHSGLFMTGESIDMDGIGDDSSVWWHSRSFFLN